MPLAHRQLGTWPETQACALTGNRTGELSVRMLALNPLSYTSQGSAFLFTRNLIVKYLLTVFINNIATSYFLTPLSFLTNNGIFFLAKVLLIIFMSWIFLMLIVSVHLQGLLLFIGFLISIYDQICLFLKIIEKPKLLDILNDMYFYR